MIEIGWSRSWVERARLHFCQSSSAGIVSRRRGNEAIANEDEPTLRDDVAEAMSCWDPAANFKYR
jgi:hypothetical protein